MPQAAGPVRLGSPITPSFLTLAHPVVGPPSFPGPSTTLVILILCATPIYQTKVLKGVSGLKIPVRMGSVSEIISFNPDILHMRVTGSSREK